MNFITGIISEELTYALGNTLLHSLWQGAAIALILAIIRLGLRRFSSNSNYLISVAALLVIFCMSVFTFIGSFQSKTRLKSELYQMSTEQAFISQPSELTQERVLDNKANHFKASINSITNYFYLYIPLIVTTWLVGLLVQSFRFAGGFFYNQRLKTNKTTKVVPVWERRFQALCNKTGVQQPVRLIESALVKVPIVIGHLKPVILLPIGLLTQLPLNQVEAILIHELAHIKRKDYLLNLFQSIIDVLFFYHPAVRWLSSVVSEERENCCDDIAVTVSGDRMNFAKALANIQTYQFESQKFAVAVIGKQEKLLQRITRLFSRPQSNSGLTEKLTSTVIIALCFVTVAAHSQSFFNTQELQPKSGVIPLVPDIHTLLSYPISSGDSSKMKTKKVIESVKGDELFARTNAKKNSRSEGPGDRIIVAQGNKQEKKDNVQIKNQTKNQATLVFPAQKNRYVNLHCAKKNVTGLYLDNIRIYDWELGNYWLLINEFVKPHFAYMKSQKKFNKYYPIIKDEYTKIKERFEKSLVHKKMLSKELRESTEKYGEMDKEFKALGEYEIRHSEEKRDMLLDENEKTVLIERLKDKREELKKHQEYVEDLSRRIESAEIDKDLENDIMQEERKILLKQKVEKIEKQLQEQHHEMEQLSGKELQSKKNEIQKMEKQIRDEIVIKKRRRLEIEEDLRRDRQDLEKRTRGVKRKISEANEKYLVNELLKDGLIDNEDDYSFEQTNKYLKINKKKQPKEIYEKYKQIVKSRYGVKFQGKLKFIISTR
jgi:bla regulator protein blaR1